MRLSDNTYSVIIVPPHALSSNIEFRVSSSLIRYAIIFAMVFFMILGFAMYKYLTLSLDNNLLKKQEKDNVRLKGETKDLRDVILEESLKLVKYEEFKKKILMATGWVAPDAIDFGRGGGPLINNGGIDPVDHSQPFQSKHQTSFVKRANYFCEKAHEIETQLKRVQDVIDLQKKRLASVPSIWPTRGYITDTFGSRKNPFTQKDHFHPGLDISGDLANPVKSTADGMILDVSKTDYYGKVVVVDHGFGYTTIYGHLLSIKVKLGERVKRGQVIGQLGNTGRCTAPHLHYEVRYNDKPLNPIHFIIE